MASSSDRTAPQRSQHDDLRLVVARSAHRRQLLLLGQHRKTKHLTIEVNRSVEISHVHHDTLKVHPLLQVFSSAESPCEASITRAVPSIQSCPDLLVQESTVSKGRASTAHVPYPREYDSGWLMDSMTSELDHKTSTTRGHLRTYLGFAPGLGRPTGCWRKAGDVPRAESESSSGGSNGTGAAKRRHN